MKKICLVFLSIVLLCMMVQVKAENSLTISDNEVTAGETFDVSVTLDDIAAWNVHVNATGPVTGCEINEADASEDAKNTDKTFTATCTTTKEGTVELVLSGDTTTEDEVNKILTGTKTVTVLKRVEVPDTAMNQSVIYALVGVTAILVGIGVTVVTLKKKTH